MEVGEKVWGLGRLGGLEEDLVTCRKFWVSMG